MVKLFSQGKGVLLILLIMVMPVAFAQTDRSFSADQAGSQVLLQELEQVQQQLLQIQSAAMTENPELQEQAHSLQQTLLKAMRDNGFEPGESLERVEQLQQRLQSEHGDGAQREAIADELRQEQQRLVAAEQEALESERVRQISDEFTENLLQAMREQDPQTDALVLELQQKHAQLQELITARSRR